MLRYAFSRFGCIGLLVVVASSAPAQKQSGQPAASDRLEQFRRLSPQDRLRQVEKSSLGEKAWHTVGRGDVQAELTERGTLDCVQVADISCRIKANPAGPAIIKWVVEDGASVKKGEKLIEFDDGALREQLKQRQIQAAESAALRAQALRERDLVLREVKLAIREGEAEVAAAERERKAFTGEDAVKKEALELKVERAKVALARAQVVAERRQLQAETDLRARATALAKDEERVRALAEDLGQSVVTAPFDGIAVYYVAEMNRFGGGGQAALVAVGEPVREGQRLLRVCDLRRMLVQFRVPEAQISRVRQQTAAEVRIDAYPNRAQSGNVATIAKTPSQADWMARDVKVYPVTVHLEGDQTGLKPGMTANVRLMLDRRSDVVTVPATAVLGKGKERFCYVRDGNDKIEVVSVVIGLIGAQSVEIKAGLREGDRVLADPRAVSARLDSKPETK